MAFSKNRRLADLITANAEQFITSAHVTDAAIVPGDLHATLDLTGKTITVANASTGDSDTTVANTAFVQQEIAALVDSSPSALNTLNELAAALGDDANFSTTVTNSIATKLPLAGGTMTGNIAHGGSLTLDVVGNISLDADDAGHVRFKDGGSQYASIYKTGSGFVIDGTGNLTLNVSGSIGIGELNPDRTFHVKSGTTNVVAKFESTDSIAAIEFTDSGGSAEIGCDGSDIVLFPSGSEKFRVNTSGNIIAQSATQNRIVLGSTGNSSNNTSNWMRGNAGYLQFNSASSGYNWEINGSNKMSMNASGDLTTLGITAIGTLAVGTTDTHSWHSVFDGRIRIGARGVLATTTGSTQLGHNFYYDGAYKYIGADFATRYYSNNGEHVWLTAPNGSADGTITFSDPRMIISNAGKVGIGTTSPDTLLNLKDTGGIEVRLEADSNNNGQEDCFIRFYTDGKTQEGIAGMDNNNSSTLFSGNTENAMVFGTVSNLPVVLATNNTERLQISAAGHVGIGTKTPDVSMEVVGPLKIRNNTAGGISQTHTNMSVANSGKIIMNFASIGTMTTGDTVVFTYSAISWKSWFFKIRYSSTGSYMGELWAGGYNNNSDGYGVYNPKNSSSNSGGGSQTTTDGATLTVARSGQGNIMTLTLNNAFVHPLFEIEYSCGGGEGFPVASRASITVNS